MNWSTRLRRWVRIRTPPVREPRRSPGRQPSCPSRSRARTRSGGWRPGPPGPRRRAPPRPARPSPGAPPRPGRGSRSSSAAGARSPFAASVAVGLGRTAGGPASASPAPFEASAATESSSSAVSAASVPESTSTWCSVSSAPSASSHGLGGEQPLEARAAASSAGATRPTGSRGRRRARRCAASTARRRAVPGARSSMVSPSSRIGSRVNSRTRSS